MLFAFLFVSGVQSAQNRVGVVCFKMNRLYITRVRSQELVCKCLKIDNIVHESTPDIPFPDTRITLPHVLPMIDQR